MENCGVHLRVRPGKREGHPSQPEWVQGWKRPWTESDWGEVGRLRETGELGFIMGLEKKKDKSSGNKEFKLISLMLEIKGSEELMDGFIKKENTLRNELPI